MLSREQVTLATVNNNYESVASSGGRQPWTLDPWPETPIDLKTNPIDLRNVPNTTSVDKSPHMCRFLFDNVVLWDVGPVHYWCIGAWWTLYNKPIGHPLLFAAEPHVVPIHSTMTRLAPPGRTNTLHTAMCAFLFCFCFVFLLFLYWWWGGVRGWLVGLGVICGGGGWGGGGWGWWVFGGARFTP